MEYAYTVYIDASDGFKSDCRSGIAICYSGRFAAYPIKKCGTNSAELEAFKLARKVVAIRPILVITDSLHVVKHGKPIENGITIQWQKRNTNEEMKLVDTLSKLVARTGQIMKGFYRSGDETHYFKRLKLAEDRHFKPEINHVSV